MAQRSIPLHKYAATGILANLVKSRRFQHTEWSMRKGIIAVAALVLIAVVGWIVFDYRGRLNEQALDDEALTGANMPNHSDGFARQQNTTQPLASRMNIPAGLIEEFKNREGLRALNHVPIAYYGIVVDEIGTPLTGTRVKWSIAYNNGSKEGYKSGEVMADAEGKFSITGEEGKSLSVFPERTGYRFVATNGGAIYSHLWPISERHIADAARPVHLTMWKVRRAEPLIRIDQQFKLPPNQGPIFVDLVRGLIADNAGDLKLIVERSRGPLSKTDPADWSLQIEAIGGGILSVP